MIITKSQSLHNIYSLKKYTLQYCLRLKISKSFKIPECGNNSMQEFCDLGFANINEDVQVKTKSIKVEWMKNEIKQEFDHYKTGCDDYYHSHSQEVLQKSMNGGLEVPFKEKMKRVKRQTDKILK